MFRVGEWYIVQLILSASHLAVQVRKVEARRTVLVHPGFAHVSTPSQQRRR